MPRGTRCAALAALVALLAAASAQGATNYGPIASTGPATTLPAATGGPATAQPLTVAQPPRHPFMAANGRSNLHNDAWMTDAYRQAGPLGNGLVPSSAALGRLCGSITFDRRGRLVTVCVTLAGPRLYLLDPRTLESLAELELPPRPAPEAGSNPFQDFTGGGYFFLDERDRVWSATASRHIFVVGQTGGGTGFRLVRDYDVARSLASDDKINSALPDWSGRIWFTTRSGKVATLDPRSGRVRVLRLGRGEGIQNSFAVDRDGAVYVVSDRRLYRFDAGRRGEPRVSWSVRYRNIGRRKPGQADAGSGTTPTLMAGGYVAITDNADPMNVVVYRRARRVRGSRRVCETPVFERGRGATENSLIAAGRSLIVENNYGYSDPSSVAGAAVSEPGVARVDVNRSGRGCRVVWTNGEVRAPSVVPKLSLANGLVYGYEKLPDPSGAEPWFWTALDYRTGRVAWRQLSGTGALAFNNNYAGVHIGPDGTLYLGVIGGIVALRDG